MSNLVEALVSDLAVAVEFFTHDAYAKQLPFMHSFPRNGCEVVSALFAHALENKYNDAEVFRVHGTNPINCEQHFWVEIDDQVLDPTAHQFEGIEVPFVCAIPSPLVAKFSDVDREPTEKALKALISLKINSDAQVQVLERLLAKLGPNPFSKRDALTRAPHVKR